MKHHSVTLAGITVRQDRSALLACTLCFCVAAVEPAIADDGCWLPAATVFGAGIEDGDELGDSVALEGAVLAVGAPDTDLASGSVFVFELAEGQWMQAAELRGSGVEEFDGFGQFIDLDNGRIVVGNPYIFKIQEAEDAAYVFEKIDGIWMETARIDGPAPGLGDAFGMGVAVSGDTLLVGATGQVYVYEFEGEWMLTQTLNSLFTSPEFGRELAVDGDTALVVDREPNLGLYHVNVYLRDIDGQWALSQTLDGDSAGQDTFGASGIALEGDLAAISASSDDEVGPNAGAAYVYRRFGAEFVQTAKILNPDFTIDDNFGGGATISGGALVLGASFFGGSGRAYLYEDAEGQWILVQTIVHPNPDVGGKATIGLSDEWLALGSSSDDTMGVNTGAVFLFANSCATCPADCNADGDLNIFDFLCFQGLVTTGDVEADCNQDSRINIFDFLCFQGLVTQGCGG